MEKSAATAVFESLASGVRLDVFRLLVKVGPEGLVAGDIAKTLALPSTTLSFHLKALTQASLLTVEQQGRYQRYRANIGLIQQLIEYLTAECCTGRAACLDLGAAAQCVSCGEAAGDSPSPRR